MSYERMAKAEGEIAAEIEAMRATAAELLEGAEAIDQAEDERYGPDRRGDELPDELARRESRLAKIREAKAALEARRPSANAPVMRRPMRRGASCESPIPTTSPHSPSRRPRATSPIPTRRS
jgi:chromosome segregation ATPase